MKKRKKKEFTDAKGPLVTVGLDLLNVRNIKDILFFFLLFVFPYITRETHVNIDTIVKSTISSITLKRIIIKAIVHFEINVFNLRCNYSRRWND